MSLAWQNNFICLLSQLCLIYPDKGIWILHWQELTCNIAIKCNSINFGLVLVSPKSQLEELKSWCLPQIISLPSLLGHHLLMDLSSVLRCFYSSSGPWMSWSGFSLIWWSLDVLVGCIRLGTIWNLFIFWKDTSITSRLNVRTLGSFYLAFTLGWVFFRANALGQQNNHYPFKLSIDKSYVRI